SSSPPTHGRRTRRSARDVGAEHVESTCGWAGTSRQSAARPREKREPLARRPSEPERQFRLGRARLPIVKVDVHRPPYLPVGGYGRASREPWPVQEVRVGRVYLVVHVLTVFLVHSLGPDLRGIG